MLLLPYIPPGTLGITEAQRARYTDAQARDLASLLNLSHSQFWSLLSGKSSSSSSPASKQLVTLPAFLDAFLQSAKSKSTGDDPRISTCAFQIFCRIALVSTPLESTPFKDYPAWAQFLRDHSILSLASLVDFACWIRHHNPRPEHRDFASAALSNLLQHSSGHWADLEATLQWLKTSIRQFAAGPGTGSGRSGKGKGKGKAAVDIPVEPPPAYAPPPPSSSSPIEITYLQDAAKSMEALVTVSRFEKLSNTMLHEWNLLPILSTAYSLSPPSPASKPFKLALLRWTWALLQSSYFSPILSTSSPEDSSSGSPEFTPSTLVTSTTESMCDLLLSLLDSTQFDGPISFLNDAPLLIDLEVAFSLGHEIQRIKAKYFAHEDDARLEYLVVSLESLLTLSGNADVKRRLSNRRGGLASRVASSSPAAAAAAAVSTTPSTEEDFIKRTSLITQVQDLFPDLGEGFIEACLVALGDDAELVIMKVLENDLPPVVTRLDRKLGRTAPIIVEVAAAAGEKSLPLVVRAQPPPPPLLPLAPPTSLLADRKNVYDGDEFDVFAAPAPVVSGGRGRGGGAATAVPARTNEHVIIGKKQATSADRLLEDKSFVQKQKNAILAMQYDDYDDEYDDTYDDREISLAGTVELRHVDENEASVDSPSTSTSFSTHKRPPPQSSSNNSNNKYSSYNPNAKTIQMESAPDPTTPFESDFVQMYHTSVPLLTAQARRSKERLAFKQKTGLSDEQIEGWLKMFDRLPANRKSALLARYEFRGNRGFKESESDEGEEEGSGSSGDEGGGGGGQSQGGRGRGRGGTSGSGGPRGRGSRRGSHSRKDARSKKMSRGMMGGV